MVVLSARAWESWDPRRHLTLPCRPGHFRSGLIMMDFIWYCCPSYASGRSKLEAFILSRSENTYYSRIEELARGYITNHNVLTNFGAIDFE
jgi:hypothetical protein